MLFVIDLDTLYVIEAARDKRPVSSVSGKRGDGVNFQVQFVRSGVAEELPTDSVLTFGAKQTSKYDAAAVVLHSDFTLSGSGETALYSGSPSFNTVALNALLFVGDEDDSNDPEFVDLMAEFTWQVADGAPTSTKTFRFRVHNDVVRDDEGTPLELPTPEEWLAERLTTESVLALLATPSSIIVNAEGTDIERGAALAAAYTSAKLLTPNGAARSATNRACVVLPPGKYKISNFQLDAEFLDIFPSVWEKPSRIQRLDLLNVPDETTVDLSCYRPGSTVIYSDVDYVSTVVQVADDVRMGGFTIAHLGIAIGFLTEVKYLTELDWGALLIGEGCANGLSQYTDLYCFCAVGAFPSCGGVRAYESFSGTWINCVANGPSFRNGWGDKVSATAEFSATMTDCEGMPFSFIGDYLSAPEDFSIGIANFTRCKGIGNSWEANDGAACFAGCNITGVEVPTTMTCTDCEAGPHSFGIGNTVTGHFIRCRGGAGSFGSTNGGSGVEGIFDGIAEDCVGGAGSFGGNEAESGGGGKCTGTLTRCTVTGNALTTRLEGATIRDSRITCTTTGVHALTLIDSNSVISNTDIIVFQGGTGVPISAASALNVAAYALRMNNATNDADGLHANVTNLVTTPGNVVSDSIS